ncbi:MAG: hypothetical protein KAY59_07930 [Acidobacteria bacterium]|nr:hypothetical protein [Acidobacteriota bacterium]
MTNVAALPGCRVPDAPNEGLVSALRDMLTRAERGELQSFIGTGFCADGMRIALWSDQHPNVYEMMGALAWLQAEYTHRHT